MALQNHSGRDAESGSELNDAILWADCQRVEHPPCEFKPAWSQHAFTSTRQDPMPLQLVGMLSFSYHLRTSERSFRFIAVRVKTLHNR